jgi:hypothetical protein
MRVLRSDGAIFYNHKLYRRRTENRDMFDQWNTVLKMAKKRALVDLALTISGASEKFTQDVEDLGDNGTTQEAERQTTTQERKSESAGNGNGHSEPPKPRPWSPADVKAMIESTIKTSGPRVLKEQQRGAVVAKMNQLFPKDAEDVATSKRHMLTKYLFGKDSTKDLADTQLYAIWTWCTEQLQSGEIAASETAAQEAAKIVEQMSEPEPLALQM